MLRAEPGCSTDRWRWRHQRSGDDAIRHWRSNTIRFLPNGMPMASVVSSHGDGSIGGPALTHSWAGFFFQFSAPMRR